MLDRIRRGVGRRLDGAWLWLQRGARRLRRLERRELRDLRRWLEHTDNLLHASVLVFVPLIVGLVTYLSNTIEAAAFLLFPPLASGTYTLFANPEGKYSSPTKFVGGTTFGALAGWMAVELSSLLWYGTPSGTFRVSPGAAAVALFLTGVVTWALDLEEPTAFSTALLVLLFTGDRTLPAFGLTVSAGLLYVIGVAASSTLVATVFAVWRETFYEQRARYLYETTRGDDHVLVPMRGDRAGTVAMFGASIAAAHDAGKVVLLDVVEDEAVAEAERAALDRLVGVETAAATDADRERAHEDAEREVAAESVRRLERQASRVETKAGVPCDVVVAVGQDHARVVQETAAETNCDLLAVPYEESRGGLSPFVRSLFGGDRDVVALRATGDHEAWRRVLVPVRRAGDQAHAMIDFALRVAGRAGTVAVCTCIDAERERRAAESMLAKLVETFSGRFETRVANEDVAAFIDDNAAHYDLTVVGASTERTRASRFLAPPTFERLSDVDCDVAVVHRGR